MLENKITLVVSTVDRGILGNPKLLNLALSESLCMVVVNQQQSDKTDLVLDKPFCKVINSTTKGLSKSRNIGLRTVLSGLAVITDDDVEYVNNFDNVIRTAFKEKSGHAILTFKIKTPEGNDFKQYREKPFEHNTRSLLKVSSIDMVVNVEKTGNTLTFDEDFGLGADFNTGENNIFLIDAYKKKLLMAYVPKTIVIHPFENSGRVLDSKHLVSKGAVLKRMFGIRAIAIGVYFCLRKKKEIELSNVNLIKAILLIFKGYFKYKRQNESN